MSPESDPKRLISNRYEISKKLQLDANDPLILMIV